MDEKDAGDVEEVSEYVLEAGADADAEGKLLSSVPVFEGPVVDDPSNDEDPKDVLKMGWEEE